MEDGLALEAQTCPDWVSGVVFDNHGELLARQNMNGVVCIAVMGCEWMTEASDLEHRENRTENRGEPSGTLALRPEGSGEHANSSSEWQLIKQLIWGFSAFKSIPVPILPLV
jgi:hypothetical protein